jgi:hypothetical protein
MLSKVPGHLRSTDEIMALTGVGKDAKIYNSMIIESLNED